MTDGSSTNQGDAKPFSCLSTSKNMGFFSDSYSGLSGVDWSVVCPLIADMSVGQLFKTVKSIKCYWCGLL